MANGIFLAASMFNGEPTLFQYTMRPDDPVVLVERYEPHKEDLTPRVVEVSEVKRINPLDYPEPLRQQLLNTPHYVRDSFHTGGDVEFVFSQPLSESFAAKGEYSVLEKSLADCIAKEVARIGQEQWDKMLAAHEVNKIPTQEEWNAAVKRIINNVRGPDA